MTNGERPGQFSTADLALLDQAAKWQPCPGLLDCTPNQVAELTTSQGLDFATAILYDRILRRPEDRSFFNHVSNVTTSSGSKAVMVGIVPGAFYRQHKNTGADGARLIEIVRALGCPCELVPVESFGSLELNASLIAQWLTKQAGRPVALLSLSKGSADLKEVLKRPDATELFRNVRSWISFSGLPDGTPLIAWLRQRPLRRLGVSCWLWLHRQRYAVVEELRHESDGPLAVRPELPSRLKVIHVVGFPCRRHLAHPWAHRAYERLATSQNPTFPTGFQNWNGIVPVPVTIWSF